MISGRISSFPLISDLIMNIFKGPIFDTNVNHTTDNNIISNLELTTEIISRDKSISVFSYI